MRKVGWILAGIIALLSGTFLIGGLLLPGAWSAEASRTVAAPPDSVFDQLAAPARWDAWTPWPEGLEFSHEGPTAGAGARRSWDDPELGAGSLAVTEAERPALVRYQVAIGEASAQRVLGTFRLEPAPEGTRVTWREEGDFGGNPLLGWAALSMRRRHGDEMARRLDDLARVLEGSAPR